MSIRDVKLGCFGCGCLDVVVRVPGVLPAAGDLMLIYEAPTYRVGGIALAAGLTVVGLGGQASYYGVRGEDLYGQKLSDLLAEQGIDVASFKSKSGVCTSYTHVYVFRDGTRSFVHCPGANESVGPEDLDLEALKKVDVAFAGGIGIVPGLHGDGLTRAMRELHGQGPLTGLDTVVPGRVGPKEALPMIASALSLVDVVIMSRKEILHFTGESEPRRAIAMLHSEGATTIFLKLGADGVLVSADGEAPVHVSGYKVEAKDTTGAGDAASGAILASLAATGSLSKTAALEAAELGMMVGGYVVSQGIGAAGICELGELQSHMSSVGRSKEAL